MAIKNILLTFLICICIQSALFATNNDSLNCKVVTTTRSLNEFRIKSEVLKTVIDSTLVKLRYDKVLGHTIPSVKMMTIESIAKDLLWITITNDNYRELGTDASSSLESYYTMVIPYKGMQILVSVKIDSTNSNENINDYIAPTGRQIDYIIYKLESTKEKGTGCLPAETVSQEIKYSIYRKSYMLMSECTSYDDVFFMDKANKGGNPRNGW